MPIQAYFDKIYAQVGNLEVVPAPRSGKWEARVVEEYTEEGQEVKRLYAEYGWPDAFRREEFIQAVERTRAAAIEAALGDDDDAEDDEMTG
ncbi:hypothetical protein CH063_15651 [Colletotrichum higginsianum]|nr:hypothetical protein CH063_15651 [Colletotrichum higginsianum]